MALAGAPLVALWAGLGWLVGGLLAVLAVALPVSGVAAVASGTCASCGGRLSRLGLALGRSGTRCASCGALLRETWPYAEAATALVFGLMASRFTLGLPLLLYSALGALLVVVVFVDVRHRLILDVVTLPAILVSIPLAFWTVGVPRAILGGLVTGGFFLAFYVLARLLYRSGGALGLGDVKLALLIGLVVGAPAALAAVFYSAIAGGLLAVGFLASGRSRYSVMPYGPSLVLGALLTVLIDPSVWR